LPALLARAPTVDAQSDELCRALTVTHDRLREQHGDFLHGLAERREIVRRARRRTRCTARNKDECVVGGGVAVNRDAIERARG
jgi:hypothetical protein